jgi:hypothetical protein
MVLSLTITISLTVMIEYRYYITKINVTITIWIMLGLVSCNNMKSDFTTLIALTSINKMSSVYSISFNSMIIDFFFPILDVSSLSFSTFGIDNFPNNKSLKAQLLALARNLSLQIGRFFNLTAEGNHSNSIHISHLRLKLEWPTKQELQDKTKFQLEFQQASTFKLVEKPSNNLRAKDETEDTKLQLKSCVLLTLS